VLGTDGKAIANATVHIWVADPNGRYDNQDDHGNPIAGLPVASLGLRARIITDARGRYSFKCLRPGNYPLDPQGKDLRPSHIHARVDAPGYKTLVTQLYFIDDGWNEHDLPGEDFFQPELVVHTTPALPEPGVTLQGVFNFVIEPK
jgi:catechol 1,2-dioxygenase